MVLGKKFVIFDSQSSVSINLNTVFNLLLNFTSALTLSSFISFSLFHFHIC